MDSEDNKTIHMTTPARAKRFIPTCPICDNQHWPRDPACLGKKGAKAKAKAKAKAAAKAKARAKRGGAALSNTSQPAEPAAPAAPVKPVHVAPAPVQPVHFEPAPSKPIHVGPASIAPAQFSAEPVLTDPIFAAEPTIPVAPVVASTVHAAVTEMPDIFVQPPQPAAQPIKPVSQPVKQAPQTVQSVKPAQSVFQPSSKPVFPPRQNTDIKPKHRQHSGGETVVNIKAKSKKEITSFDAEITRIKRQADEVVLRTCEDASHRVQSERTARKNAEEKARNEVAARLKAEQKLHTEIAKLKALRQEIKQSASSNTRQMQNLQSQFTADTNTNTLADRQAATTPSIETQLETTSRRVPPSHTNSNVGTLLAIRARDIMESNVVCVSGEETISTVLDRMLAKDSHYAIVNGAEQTEGLVSRGELTGPICEYLKPFIAKWQRPGSDATFNVAVKWVMSRQINTIAPDATCTAIMKKMRALNMSPLLVVEGGKAIGLVTPFNVFKIRALLKLEGDNTTTTNRQLIQALPTRISSYMSGLNLTSHANLHVVE